MGISPRIGFDGYRNVLLGGGLFEVHGGGIGARWLSPGDIAERVVRVFGHPAGVAAYVKVRCVESVLELDAVLAHGVLKVDLAARVAGELVLHLPDGQEISLPKTLVRVLLASASELSEGHAVTVLASEVQLTPSEVSELLGLSRPFVVRLLDAGEIRSEYLPDSRHRVVRLADVLEFQAQRERRRTGRCRVADAVADADLPY